MPEHGLFGIMAQYPSAHRLVRIARRARQEGYRDVEAYTPFPVEGLSEALGLRNNRLPLIALLGGLAFGGAIYLTQYWSAVWLYPFNIGGRPFDSWPAFIPITVEVTILGAVLGIFFGMLVLNRLPALYHPAFNGRGFEAVTRDGFFLCIRASDPQFDAEEVRRLLHSFEPITLSEVPE